MDHMKQIDPQFSCSIQNLIKFIVENKASLLGSLDATDRSLSAFVNRDGSINSFYGNISESMSDFNLDIPRSNSKYSHH